MKNKPGLVFLALAIIGSADLFANLGFISNSILRLVWVLSVCLFVYATLRACTDFTFESKYFRGIFFLFLAYEAVMVFRGLTLNPKDLMTIFREPPIFWAFFVPVFAFFDKKFENIAALFKSVYVLSVIFLILCICFPFILKSRFYAQTIIGICAVGAGFLLMNARYLTNKKTNIALLTIVISFLAFTYLARRSSAFTFFGFLTGGMVINYIRSSGKWIFKLLPFVFVSLAFLVFINAKSIEGLTANMSDRLYDDSRSGLYEMFFIEMENYMVFGKGMHGTYYYPMEESVQYDGTVYGEEVYRNNIENGYLQLLLTGGVVHIILFVLVLLPAAFLGLFKSSNQFTRACGAIVLLWMVDMFLYGLPTLSIHYILVWICVGFCYRTSLRQQTDDELTEQIWGLAEDNTADSDPLPQPTSFITCASKRSAKFSL